MQNFIVFEGLDGAGKSNLIHKPISIMKTKKYHIRKGFPKEIQFPKGKYLLKYTKHAIQEIKNDKYVPNNIEIPNIINFDKVEFIEIETIDNKLSKFLVRIDFNAELCLCLVILKEDYVVKTAWFNLKNDNHKNLDLTKYNRP